MPSHFFRLRRVLVLAVLFVGVPRASADAVPWNYTGSIVTTGPSTTTLPGAGPPNPHILLGASSSEGGGLFSSEQVQFADVTGSGSGSSSVTGFQVRASTFFSGALFSSNIHTFNFGFTILDQTSGASGTLTFKGGLNGVTMQVFTPPSMYTAFANVQGVFTGPSQQSLLLGNHLYTVSIAPFAVGAGANLPTPLPVVTPYVNVPVSVVVTDVPEPSTLVLASAALAGLGWRAWRRRRLRLAVA